MSDDRFDLVLWGATGFTGQLVAEALAAREGSLRWAIAGRSPEKLGRLAVELAERWPAAGAPPTLVADSFDETALAAMVARARVVCSTVGPYARYGTPLVAACVAAGVDYCDLTGEVHWIREMIDRFHEKAGATGARIVHCCGFDSIPSDLGTLVLSERLRAEGRSLARARFRLRVAKGGASGGTVASLFGVLEAAKAEPKLRRVLGDPYALLPTGAPRGKDRNERLRAGYDADRGRSTAPFVMAAINTRIVRRSNALLGFPYGEGFRYDEAIDTGPGLGGRVRAFAYATGLGAFIAAAALPPTAALLRRFVLPSPGEGPTPREQEAGFFRADIHGESEGPDPLRARVRVAADRDPGYGATAIMLSGAALALVEDEPLGGGGVLTPASALGMPLVERLRRAGMTFAAELLAPA